MAIVSVEQPMLSGFLIASFCYSLLFILHFSSVHLHSVPQTELYSKGPPMAHTTTHSKLLVAQVRCPCFWLP